MLHSVFLFFKLRLVFLNRNRTLAHNDTKIIREQTTSSMLLQTIVIGTVEFDLWLSNTNKSLSMTQDCRNRQQRTFGIIGWSLSAPVW